MHIVSSRPAINDPGVPNLIWARDVHRQIVALITDPSTIRRLEEGGINAKIGEYCGLIHGGVHEGIGLINSHALFRGLKRPCTKLGRDSEIYIYVLDAPCTFVYRRNDKYTGKGPEKYPKPLDSVFVTYVDLNAQSVELKSAGPTLVQGTILYWEWVFADPSCPSLPKDYETRYLEQIW